MASSEGKEVYQSLSLLDKEDLEQQEAHQYTKAMFHGRISSINPNKKMEMEDIAKTDDGSILKGRRRCILVEGAPGVGKSTFAWKLCQKWGKGKILQQYRVMLLLRLREKRVRGIEKDKDIFRRCEPIAVEGICRNGGEGVFLLLEGWDELPEELREEDSFFLDLIQGQVLPDATVLVTSRPHASEIIVTECIDYVFQHIQVAGFTEENVQAFISSSVGDDSKLLEGLQTYVSSYPHIESMMYNPLNAAIVVKVYRNSYKDESTIPKTMTELYSSLIRSLLLRYLKEHSVHGRRKWSRRLRQFSDLPSDVYQQFCEVCRIAYEGITNRQQVIFTDLPDDFNSLDLMQYVPELYVDKGAVPSYNFLHLTIQEFLAAYHVSLQSAQEKVEFFRNHQKAQSNQMVLKFFAGLTNLEDISDDELLPQPSDIALTTIHFLFEAKQRIKMLNALSKVILNDRYKVYVNPFDSYVLGYIASLTTCSWKIQIDCRISSASAVAMLVKGTLDPKHENLYLYPAEALPVSLRIEGGGCCGWDCTDLSYFFKAHPSFLKRIISLKLQDMGLDGHFLEVFSKSMSLIPHLQVLDLNSNLSIGYSQEYDISPSSSSRSHCSSPLDTLSIDSSSSQLDSQLSSRSDYPASAVKLIDALKTQNTVKLLDFSDTNIGEPECEALAQWLSSPTCSLRVLKIGVNELSIRFHILEFGGNFLSCQSIQVLITSLCQNCTLNELDISRSSISLELLPSLIQLPLLQLDLTSCKLGPEEMCVIARALCGNSKLEILYIKNNPIRDEGARELADMLMQNKTLKYISLNKCEITEQGAQALQNSLEHNDTLLHLHLSETSIDKRIAYDIYYYNLYADPNDY